MKTRSDIQQKYEYNSGVVNLKLVQKAPFLKPETQREPALHVLTTAGVLRTDTLPGR